MSLSFAVIVCFGVTVRLHDQVLVAAIRGGGAQNPARHISLPPTRCVARAETCQLACHSATMLAGQQCRGVTLHGLWTKYIIYMKFISIALLQKKKIYKKRHGCIF